MNETNYVVMTAATCEFSYRDSMIGLMSNYSKDLISKAGAIGTRFGSIGTGEQAGNLLFIQFYKNLEGYQKGLELQNISSDFKEIFNSGKVNIYLRNIATSLPLDFPTSTEHPKYIVITRAEASLTEKDRFLNCINKSASAFKDNGALTMKFGNLITGSNVGNYLLGVGYPSMEAIEKTYDELANNNSYKELLSFAKINMRNIIKIL